MYKDVLRTIAGIEIFPMLSLVVFLAVFVVMLVWVIRLDRRRLEQNAHLPLDEAMPFLSPRAGRRTGGRK